MAGFAEKENAAGASMGIGGQINRQERKRGFFAPIVDAESALEAARMGAFAGVAWLVMLSIGLAGLLLFNLAPGSARMPPEQLTVAAVITVVMLLLVAFLTWRIHIGKGYISAIALMALLIVNAFLGAGIVQWGLYLAMMVALVNGIRGCLAYRRFAKVGAKVDAAAFD